MSYRLTLEKWDVHGDEILETEVLLEGLTSHEAASTEARTRSWGLGVDGTLVVRVEEEYHGKLEPRDGYSMGHFHS